MNEFLEAGKIVAVRGIKGEVKIDVYCDSPQFVSGLDTLFVGKDKKSYRIEKSFPQKGQLIVKFENIDLPAAEQLVGTLVYAKKDAFDLEEGVFFVDDLIGMAVIDADTGVEYGLLKDVIQTGARDVYVIKGKKELLVPAIPDVIISVDINEKKMAIRPLEGLFDL